MKDLKIGSGLALVFGVLLMTGMGCTNYQIPGKGGTPQANMCEDCHTDYDKLMAVYTPDTDAPITLCDLAAPHIEPYDRVFMGGDGYDAFKNSTHYSVGCTGCHNGDKNADNKNDAHSGEWTASPSMAYAEKCATCHETITGTFVTSLHNGTGLKRDVAMRAGQAGADEFDQLPAHQIEGYNAKCSSCHGTCGNCHVVRPLIAGGGLMDGHKFNKTPDMELTCVKCHTRGGNAFLGDSPGTQPDAHLTENGYDCLSCHDGHELHGDGQPVEQRYAYTELPECESCHPGLETANIYHTKHMGDFSCQVCHSQDYNTCGAWDVKDGQVDFGPYMDFKIALNPIPGLKDFKFALVQRTSAHPDNWIGYGEDLGYTNFDVLPTYSYTTPHNILRKTGRTDVAGGFSCSYNCHIRNNGGVLLNSELYLWADSLETWEVDATGPYTVDGQLPSYWFN
jgi:thiosulfate/3-mercaptopyruvate sulfurtransferase